MHRIVMFFLTFMFFQPFLSHASENENIKARLFFQIAATDMNCKLEYDKYVLMNTQNYLDSPMLATFGYGIDANDIFKSGENEIKLIVTPVDKPRAQAPTDRYCEVRLSGSMNKAGKNFDFSTLFVIRLDKDGIPFSVNVSRMDFPQYDKEEKNNIIVNYKKDNGANTKVIESIILNKKIITDFK